VARLRFSAAAREDLNSIARYIADKSGSPPVAVRFVRELQSACRRLAEAPITMGRPRPELRPDLRSFSSGNYIIFFRYRGDILEIVNVLEGHRDIAAFFRKEER
jgi:toxin ParE1/3/4